MTTKYSSLKGFNSVFDYSLNNEIQDGIIEYYDWALLEKGNYFNVDLNETGPNGNDLSKLRLESNPHYTSGQLWSGFRGNWVWQSGVGATVGTNNTRPGLSGVYVNDVFYETATTTGTYAHSVDYYNGRILFSGVLPKTATVQAEYSYKWINIVYSESVPWLRQIQTDTDDATSIFYDTKKGSWNVPAESRLQLPAIAVEIVPRRTFKPYALGGGQWVYTDVLFYCIAEDEVTRNKLVDIVSLQNNKTIHLLNTNLISSSGEYPLNYMGSPQSGALRYPDLVDKYDGGKLRFINTVVQDMKTFGPDLYGGVVRVTTEGLKKQI